MVSSRRFRVRVCICPHHLTFLSFMVPKSLCRTLSLSLSLTAAPLSLSSLAFPFTLVQVTYLLRSILFLSMQPPHVPPNPPPRHCWPTGSPQFYLRRSSPLKEAVLNNNPIMPLEPELPLPTPEDQASNVGALSATCNTATSPENSNPVDQSLVQRLDSSQNLCDEFTGADS